MKTVGTIFAVVALPLLVAPSVRAQETAPIAISIEGAEPGTAQGRALVKVRAARAASEFCDVGDARYGLKQAIAQRQCRTAIVAAALARFDGLQPVRTLSARR